MQPAVGILELASVAVGILTGDAMVKRSPVEVLYAGTVHPGKYLVLVGGEVAEVEEALAAGRAVCAGALVDELFLPDAHPEVVESLRGRHRRGVGEALGVVETRTVAAIVGAADRGMKGAEVDLTELRLADGLGGKAYCLFRGVVSEVEAAVEVAVSGLGGPELLISQVVIPQIHEEMLENLEAAAELMPRLRRRS